MIVDTALINELAKEFVRKWGGSHFSGTLLPGNDMTVLGSATKKFHALYVTNLYTDSVLPTNATGADTVDGFHASATPGPNRLLALDAAGKFPTSVYDQAVLKTGDTLTGHLNAAAGVLIDGVDVNLFKAAYDAHLATNHNGVPVHTHLTSAQGGDLTQFAHADGQGSRMAHMAQRLNKSILPGNGLQGGGLLDQDITVSVRAGAGLSFSSGALVLSMPGTLSAGSGNTAEGNHTHVVEASSDPSGTALLKADSAGGLRLRRLAIGSATATSAGDVRASGDIRGNRILSDQDAFVGNDLTVGSTVLTTAKARNAVQINPETPLPDLFGALTVRPGTAQQRGIVVQGKTDQIETAPLLAVANAQGQDLFVVRSSGTLESGAPAFVSGLAGWRISHEGDAEFRNITARGELHTSVFVANEMHAAGGTLAVMPTGVVDTPAIPTDNIVNTTFNLVVSGDPNLPGVSPFALNDVLRIKLLTGLEEN
jgi:hypothetical protein